MGSGRIDLMYDLDERREAEATEWEVMRRVSDSIHHKLVKIAVKDALEQHKPQW
jgi:hypothetical protein